MAPNSSTPTFLHIDTSMRTAYPRPYDALVPGAQENRIERVQILSPLLVNPLLAAATNVGVTLPEELTPQGPNRKATPGEAQGATSWGVRYLALRMTQEKTWSAFVQTWLRTEDEKLQKRFKEQRKLLYQYSDRLALERKEFGEEREWYQEELTKVKSELETVKGELSQSKAGCEQAVAEKDRIDGQLIKFEEALAATYHEYTWLDITRRRENQEWESKMEAANKEWERKIAAEVEQRHKVTQTAKLHTSRLLEVKDVHIRELEEDNSKTTAQLDKAKAEAEALRGKLAETKETALQMECQARDELCEVVEEKMQLKEKLRGMEAELKACRERLEKEKDIALESEAIAREDMVQLIDEKYELRAQVNDLQHRLTQAEAAQSGLAEELKAALAQVQSFKSEKHSALKRLDELLKLGQRKPKTEAPCLLAQAQQTSNASQRTDSALVRHSSVSPAVLQEAGVQNLPRCTRYAAQKENQPSCTMAGKGFTEDLWKDGSHKTWSPATPEPRSRRQSEPATRRAGAALRC